MPDSSKHIKITSNTNLLDLDDDALRLIFGKCSLRELIILMKTCRSFHFIISKLLLYKNSIKKLKVLYDTGILNIQDDNNFIFAIANKKYPTFILKAINFKFDRIHRIRFFKENGITNKVLTFISRWCRRLTSLQLRDCKNVSNIYCLNQCKMLNSLDLGGCVRVMDVSCLKQFSELNYLSLWGCQKVKDVSCLNKCNKLKMLVLSYCTGISDVSCLSQCNMLNYIELYRCRSLTQKNIESLRNDLKDCEIKGGNVALIKF